MERSWGIASVARATRRTRRRAASAAHPLQWDGRTPLCLPSRAFLRAPRALLPLRLAARFVRRHRGRRLRAVRAHAARGPLRRLSADRVLSRHADRRAVARSSASRSRSPRSPPGWDGWNPEARDRGLARAGPRRDRPTSPLLELPEVDLIVAWTSLPLARAAPEGARHRASAPGDPPRSRRRPPRRRHRDRSGAGDRRLAAHRLDPAPARRSSSATRSIIWNDDLRNAPQLVLDRVQFRLENRFGRHRFGIAGTPPAELAAPLDLRGDVHGGSLKDWQKARGELYVRLDYADVAAWREWLPLPPEIASGKGALRVWFEFARARRARSSPISSSPTSRRARASDLPELDLAHLVGTRRLAQLAARSGRSSRATRLRRRGRRAARADELHARRCATASGDRAAGGQLEFDRLQLAPLRDLAAHPAAAGRGGAPISRASRRAGR